MRKNIWPHLFLFCCILLVATGLTAGGKGLPAYMAREYSDISIDEVATLAQSALEGRKFSIMDIDEDDDGDVIIETFRKAAFMMPAGNLIMRLRPTSDNRIRATIAYDSGSSAEGKILALWDDLDREVVGQGGCAWKQKRDGDVFSWCPGSTDWVPASVQALQQAQAPEAESHQGPAEASGGSELASSNGDTSDSEENATRFCIECGKGIPGTAKFCPFCGTKQEND